MHTFIETDHGTAVNSKQEAYEGHGINYTRTED